MIEVPYVLMVDDNELDLELSIMAFKKINHRVPIVTKPSGQHALDFLLEQQVKDLLPEIMFLDLKMPVMDGFELLEKIYFYKLKTFPIIVFSGSGLPEDRAKALQLGADALHEKPFDYFGNIRMFRRIMMHHADHMVPNFA